MAEMTAQDINDLPDSAFAYIEEGGKKDDQGKTTPRSLRHFPIHDAAHVRAALARAPQSPYGEKAMPKILAAAKKFGINTGDSNRSEDMTWVGPQMFTRSYTLEDIAIRAGGDGRTVSAYAAVFDKPAEIRDFDGHYMETISRTAFDKTLAERAAKVQVFYNHGKTLYGTPSERFSLPIGVPEEIRADGRGLFTVTRYNRTDLADEILEAIRNGDITSQSFSGKIYSSRRPAERLNGLKQIVRTEMGLIEYGPTPIPSYDDAAIVGVRYQELVDSLDQLDPEQRIELLERYGTPQTADVAPPQSDPAGADQATTGDDNDPPVSGDHVSGPTHAERQQRLRLLTLGEKFR